MVLPFALVIAVGFYLFLFQSIYTASCSPHLQHIQSLMSTVSWINVAVASPSCVAVAVDMMESPLPTMAPLSRFIWDPGGMLPIAPVNGIDRPLVPLHASIGLMSMSPIDPVDVDRPPAPSASTTIVAHLPPTTVIRLIWDPGIASCAIDRRVWDPGVDVGSTANVP